MNWSTPASLRAQVQKRWDRGELLRHMVTGDPMFPLRLSFKGPTSTDISGSFDAVRAWIADLLGTAHLRIEMREFTHRLLGSNTVPQSVWVESLEDALALVGKRRDAACFHAIVDRTRQAQPLLIDWLAKRPLQALELAEVWDRLLDVVAWMQAHPRPGIFLRQVDVPGVHSKFIESHRGPLAEMVDRVLPPEAVTSIRSGVSQFAARYGFREKPALIRFRVLDERLTPVQGISLPDITLDADSFAQLHLSADRVFITENETNFLAFPRVENGIVIFGAGYGWDSLAKAQWLNHVTIHYWGDIDTHGFAILNQLRSRFGHVESFLMDRETLMRHKALWGREEEPILHDLPMLAGHECDLFNDLRDNRIRENLRLEQEMVGFGWVETVLSRMLL